MLLIVVSRSPQPKGNRVCGEFELEQTGLRPGIRKNVELLLN